MMEVVICPICKKNTLEKKYSLSKFKMLFCNKCLISFTHPIPKNLSSYYKKTYWESPSLLGLIKNSAFSFFQSRRAKWIKKYLTKGNIIDVGSGEAVFASKLDSDFQVTNLDSPNSKISNPNVLKKDLLRWRTNKKYDAIVFWESLEHIRNPNKYIKKATSILKRRGYLFIEYPNNSSLEAQIFGRHWFHLDAPRHLNHFTPKGLRQVLLDNKFNIIEEKSILALEYTIWGFAASLLAILGIHITDSVKQSKYSIIALLALSPILIFALISEICFYLVKNTPLRLIVAQKNHPA